LTVPPFKKWKPFRPFPEFPQTAANSIDPLAHLHPGQFLLSPGLWVGLAISAAFLAAAVQLRRTRDPI